jgi:cysteine synthase A
MKFNDIAAAIGRTPLVRLNRLPAENSATVYAKLESSNPGASVKDRISLSMIVAGEKDGTLKAGMTIVEPTSGNTGIGLAMIAAARGYRCVLVMPESMSLERRSLMKIFGAELVLTPGPEGMKGAIAKSAELAKADDHFQPFQFSNPANPEVHRLTTGPEIAEDMADTGLDAFVVGVGTGGTITGAGGVLKEKFGSRLVAVEPVDSPVLSGGDPGPHMIQGIGAGFIPDNYDSSIVDDVIQVSNEDAIATAQGLARQEGILAGISSGANVFAALKVAAELGAGKTVVVIVADTGERYLSTAMFEPYR